MAAAERLCKYRVAQGCRGMQLRVRGLAVPPPALAPRPPCRRASVAAFAGLSPFDSDVSAFIRQSDQEFADLSRQLDRDFDNAFRRMDRMFDQSWRDMDRMQRQMDEEESRALREAQLQQPGVRLEQLEQRGVSSYRYYQSIEIRSGVPIALVPAHAAPAAAPSPLLIAALALSALWAAATARFASNYGLTLFAEKSKLRLLAAWPYLAAFSAKFRAQFLSALRGEQVKAAEQEGGEGGGGGGKGGA